MTQQEARQLQLGVYVLLWNSGGHSVVSVGENDYGDRWFAPTNWVGGIPCFQWDIVGSAVLLATQYNDPNVDAIVSLQREVVGV